MTEPVVLYNGACPVCAAGATQYRAMTANEDGCEWIDSSTHPEELHKYGLTKRQVMYRVHCLADGRMLKGMRAVTAIMEQSPRFRRLGALSRKPGVNILAAAAYEIVAAPLYVFNRWREWAKGFKHP